MFTALMIVNDKLDADYSVIFLRISIIDSIENMVELKLCHVHPASFNSPIGYLGSQRGNWKSKYY